MTAYSQLSIAQHMAALTGAVAVTLALLFSQVQLAGSYRANELQARNVRAAAPQQVVVVGQRAGKV